MNRKNFFGIVLISSLGLNSLVRADIHYKSFSIKRCVSQLFKFPHTGIPITIGLGLTGLGVLGARYLYNNTTPALHNYRVQKHIKRIKKDIAQLQLKKTHQTIAQLPGLEPLNSSFETYKQRIDTNAHGQAEAYKNLMLNLNQLAANHQNSYSKLLASSVSIPVGLLSMTCVAALAYCLGHVTICNGPNQYIWD